jgi:hypothetical protein
MAIACAAAYGNVANASAADDVTLVHAGKTRVAAAFRELRSVSHLWCAVMLHKQEYMGTHNVANYRDLVRTERGTELLLRTAHSVQLFTQGYRDRRTGKPEQLLGSEPWLVVSDSLPLSPVWAPEEMADWLAAAIRKYRA